MLLDRSHIMIRQGVLIRLLVILVGVASLGLLIYRPHTLYGEPTPPAFPPQRIASLSLTADEVLLALLPPERIIALTHLADNATYSNVVVEAGQVRHRLQANAEQVIALQPDLVVVSASSYTGGTAKALLRQTGIPLFPLKWYESVSGIQQSIVELGHAVGEDGKAEALVADMRQRIQAVQDRVADTYHPRVLYFAPDGFTAGKKTNIDEIITIAGGRNVAAMAGIEYFRKISHETLVMMNPEVILLSHDPQSEAPEESYQWLYANPALQDVAAIQEDRVYAIPRPYVDVLSHHVMKGVEAVAQLLHPGVFSQQNAVTAKYGD